MIPKKDLIEPAVKGTLNVLRACSKAGTVKKVVITSSMAAITDEPENNYLYTEKDWNTKSSETRNPYYYSKLLAEQAAWKYGKEHKDDFEIVVINPVIVIGPHLAGALNESTDIFKNLLNGKFPALLDLNWPLVDVRDVAKAHILAMENKKAEGRYICSTETISMKDTVTLMLDKYPQYRLPKRDLSCKLGAGITKGLSFFEEKGTGQYLRANVGKYPRFDNSKLKELGFEFIPVKQSIFDTCEDLISNGHVNEPKQKRKCFLKGK